MPSKTTFHKIPTNYLLTPFGPSWVCEYSCPVLKLKQSTVKKAGAKHKTLVTQQMSKHNFQWPHGLVRFGIKVENVHLQTSAAHSESGMLHIQSET